MADTPEPVPQLAQDDPFDLGDTGISFQTPAEPAKKPVPPKGPDGKFISPSAVEPPQPKHPSALVSQARDFGLEDETIEGMSTPALYRTVNLFLAREREIAKSFATQRSLNDATVPQPPPQVPEPEADPLDALVGEGFDPRLIEAVKGTKKESAAKIKALEEKLAQQEQQSTQREISDKMTIVDLAFAKLANPMLGEGTGIDLAKDPSKVAEFKRRIAVLNAAGITDMRQVNRLTIMKLIREANEMLFGAAKPASVDPYAAALSAREQPGAAKPRISDQEWNNGGVARPSQRNGSPELKGDALAIKNLTEKFREQNSQRTDDAELEGIPD